MHEIQRERARAYFEKLGLERALIGSAAAVTWLTGLAVPAPTGPNPFAGAPPLVWYESGAFTLILIDALAGLAAEFALAPRCRVLVYRGYSVDEPIQSQRFLLEALSSCVRRARGVIGADIHEIPAFIAPILGPEVKPIDGWSLPLREIKTEEELIKLRENFRLADIGQKAAKEAVKAGATEMDVYLAAFSAIHRAAGEVVPIGNDFVSSGGENNIGGLPTNRPIGPGESCIVDISTVRFGYWSDSCATYYVDEPTDVQRARHKAVADVLEAGIEMLRPGVRACDVDLKLRTMIESFGYPAYPHHTGHGVGVTGHEGPRIVPYNEQPLEAGMVVMLEPGTYVGGESAVRLEHAVLIRDEGPELLTTHIIGI